MALLLGLLWGLASCGDEPSPDQNNTAAPATEGAPCSPEGATAQALSCQGGRWVKPSSEDMGCTAQDDASFCAQQQAQCGLITGKDNCGRIRTLNCGDCQGQPCQANKCACAPDSDQDLCGQLNKGCGALEVMDNCQQPRTIMCGTCPENAMCDEEGQCVCAPESDATFCSRQSKECGMVSAEDNCGQQRANVDCGTCPNTTCDQATNTCL